MAPPGPEAPRPPTNRRDLSGSCEPPGVPDRGVTDGADAVAADTAGTTVEAVDEGVVADGNTAGAADVNAAAAVDASAGVRRLTR
ncbi:hypothetical protein GCM10018785_71840 [Streptomyces longispororuber]|uniref:Uncharacterized protein n=1 Tax=Streptomyces longispororuber TaxID=68230 RepID=A0A919ACB6_9ACTN|nr:hypothetical protein GCM10018785_71840 [Streptomyces longispororuber]